MPLFSNYFSPRKPVCDKRQLRKILLSIVSLTPSIAVSAVSPCSIATIKVFSKFGAVREKFYIKKYRPRF